MHSIAFTPVDHAQTVDQSTFTDICLGSCRRLLGQLQAAKTRILAEFSGKLQGNEHMLELAVNEAEALAWDAGFPELLFPTLAVEKASAVARWQARQQVVREHAPHSYTASVAAAA